jgi:hypothetical protein
MLLSKKHMQDTASPAKLENMKVQQQPGTGGVRGGKLYTA